MSRTAMRIIAAAAPLVFGLAVASGPATAAEQTATEQKTFVGYGYLPSDAHAAAVAQMEAYSSSCVEQSTVYSSAGSEHYWKATLTAIC